MSVALCFQAAKVGVFRETARGWAVFFSCKCLIMCVLGLVRYFFGLCFYGLVFSVFYERKVTKGNEKQIFLVLVRYHFENLRIFAAEFGFKLK
jgi:hypothetical protein